jgi:protein-disulfide isomerase
MTKSSILIALSLIVSTLAATFSGLALLVVMGFLPPLRSPPSFDAQARSYLLKHPEVLVKSIQRFEDQKQALLENKNEIFKSPLSPTGGNPNGDVTLVEFFDYRCPWCRKARPLLNEAIKADNGLRIVFKEWPILGSNSRFAARAALASHMQGKYEPFHQALMTSASSVNETSTLEIAKSIGLDVERLKRDMESEAVNSEIERNFALAKKLRLTGTPAFVIGEEILPGFVDLAALQQTLACAGDFPARLCNDTLTTSFLSSNDMPAADE